jgi:hypothetical protein
VWPEGFWLVHYRNWLLDYTSFLELRSKSHALDVTACGSDSVKSFHYISLHYMLHSTRSGKPHSGANEKRFSKVGTVPKSMQPLSDVLKHALKLTDAIRTILFQDTCSTKTASTLHPKGSL